MSSLKSKFDQIKGTLDEWKLNAQEQACLVGQGTGCALGNDTACAIGVIDLESSAAKHLEERFDAILEIIEKLKSMTADSQYPARWLRATKKHPIYEGKTPLAYINDGGHEAAQNVLNAMNDGP